MKRGTINKKVGIFKELTTFPNYLSQKVVRYIACTSNTRLHQIKDNICTSNIVISDNKRKNVATRCQLYKFLKINTPFSKIYICCYRTIYFSLYFAHVR